MVLYKCELCNKEFNKKYNYTMHINRKKYVFQIVKLLKQY